MHTPVAKISRPRLSKVYPRTRLFRILDRSRDNSITWLSGPGGSGKTTLIASYLDARKLSCLWYRLDEGDADLSTFFYYMGLAAKKAAPRYKKPLPLLTREYLMGVPAFTKRYFETIYGRLKPPFVLVFDNYQDVPGSSFHETIRHGLANVPPGIKIIILSRGGPPAALVDLQAKNSMDLIGWESLRFTARESFDLLRPRCKEISREAIRELCERTQGWAAGLILMTGSERSEPGMPNDAGDVNQEHIFDYFAGEILNRLDGETRNFLLLTSFLPDMTALTAEQLTGNAHAARILLRLNRDNFFTEKRAGADPFYRYHPLFREFLQARARESYPPEKLKGLRFQAAQILERTGQIEDAAELYCASDAWTGLMKLVLAIAPAMISQGRNQKLEEWLKRLPEKLLNNEPWLLYWRGLCRMPFNPEESRGYYERAFSSFMSRREPAGIFLAWARIAESIGQQYSDFRQFDRWITVLDDLMEEYRIFPSAEIEFDVSLSMAAVLAVRQPWHPHFKVWREKAIALLDSNVDINLKVSSVFYLIVAHFFIGEVAVCERILNFLRQLDRGNKHISPFALHLLTLAEVWFGATTGDFAACFQKTRDGLAKSKETGVHIWDHMILTHGLAAYLNAGDMAGAGKLLDIMIAAKNRTRALDKFAYHHRASWYYFLMRDMPKAFDNLAEASRLVEKAGWWFYEADCDFAAALLLREFGEQKRARAHLVRCLQTARKSKSKLLEYKSGLLASLFAFDGGNKQEGNSNLEDALALGRKQGFAYFTWWVPSMMAPLLIKALEAGIETEFVRGLISKCGLAPDEPPLHLDNWPWPIRIYTLGGFSLFLNDKPVLFIGKVQKKPLDLLKALIAFGGSDVSEGRITDALWPDAEGDVARISFKTNLHRLRQLLGKDEMIQVQDGRMSLDRRLCWVDAWAFERQIHDGETEIRDGENGRTGEREKKLLSPSRRLAHSPVPRSLERALSLYRGHFLADDEDKMWTTSLREQLKRKFVQAVGMMGGHSEREKAWKKEIAVYERGLEVDELSEEFYQKLMSCHLKLGRKAEAVKVYHRCRKMLTSSLGVGPSEETETLHKKIIGI